MTTAELVERLSHGDLGAAPRSELEWLATHGSLQHLEVGDLLSAKGVRIDHLFVLLSGRTAIHVDHGTGPKKVMEWRGGEVSGTLPYSRMGGPPGDAAAEEPTTVLAVHRDLFPQLIRECPEVTAILVHLMLDRARVFTSSDLQDEKMLSLGRLSAGLAHELNNPASAIERSAALLVDRLDAATRAARALGAARLTSQQLEAADAAREHCLFSRAHGVRSPIEQAEREEAIADWLQDHHIDVALAESIADTDVTIETLDQLAGAIEGPLDVALRSAATECGVRSLASEIQEAATRISGLVAAIKGFTRMDQAMVAEPVDLRDSLNNTVVVLKSKARAKSASVSVEIEPGLPSARGFAGELNQIWLNLIDNALDAVPESGRVDVRAVRERDRLAVRVVDNGPGIPDQIRERIFDPFFTTKGIGQGTGLGLDIVRRLVKHNDGQITVESRPGRTEFRVLLPMAVAAGAGEPS
jgi:signal transduction histidine kinase